MPTIDYYISLNSPWTYLGQRSFRRDRQEARLHGECEARQVCRGFRQNRWPTPGEAGTRAPCLSAHGSQTLARPPRHSDQYRTEVLSLGRGAWNPARPSGMLQGKDAHRLATEIGKALWEMEQSIADPAALAAAAERAGLDAEAIRKAGPSDAELDGMHDELTAEAIKRGVFRRAKLRACVG